jgi:FkbM family methyltransferase
MNSYTKLRIKIAKFFLRLYPLPIGRTIFSNLLLLGTKLPDRASFEFDFGRFENVSIKKWPYGYRDLLLFGRMEEDELFFWTKYINVGDSIIDVGANFGYWTLVGSKLVGSKGTVHSFEPINHTFSALSSNIQSSNAKNVKLYNIALGEIEAVTNFNIASEDSIGGSSSQGFHNVEKFDSSQEVFIKSADEVINLQTKITFVKIDVEGGELFVLKGMHKIIEKFMPVISFEWNFNTAKSMGYDPIEIIEYLKTFGYSISIISGKKMISFERSHYAQDRVLMLWAIKS